MTTDTRPRPAFEHPWAVRFCHWSNAVAMTILTLSGLRIFSAFPSFGSKIPQHDLIEAVPQAVTLGGWLGGALQWHFTFMWIFGIGGALYVISQLASGHYRTVVFARRDISGVWPMARHYFLFGPKPAATGQYNPLQKLAYTSALLLAHAVAAHGRGDVQARTTVDPRRRVWRLPRCAAGPFPRHVRPAGVHPRTPDDGGAARVGQLHVHAHRVEAAPRV